MVDKALFIGTSGAKDSMHQLGVITNNLANTSTTGFRADFESVKQYNVNDSGQQTRTYSSVDQTYSDFTQGSVINTGRELDIAISGDGFLAVQNKSGEEAYTRAGDLQVLNGLLKTRNGQLVKGVTGIIAIPNNAERVSIGADGTIAAKIKGEPQPVTLNRLKFTNPPVAQLQKGTDGLFYLKTGSTVLPFFNEVKLTPGALEGSNVNAVETLTNLIELSRSFELHTNMMKAIKDLSSKANELLTLK